MNPNYKLFEVEISALTERECLDLLLELNKDKLRLAEAV